MNKILPILILLIAIGGSGFAAKTLRGGGEAAGSAAKGKDGDTKDGGVHSIDGKAEASAAYFDFARNFIVPVIRGERVGAVVLITLSVEMDEGLIDDAKSREPKIRDAFMKTLLQLSHEGFFSNDITSPEVYDALQTRLLDTAKYAITEKVDAVLIVDFARQDQ